MTMPKITDVPGIKVGHATDDKGLTGCTVVLCEEGAIGGVDVRGSAPGTRETDVLRPMNLVKRVHAVLLAGGSAFGLAAADGVMRFLEERGIGFEFGGATVPIVPAANLFDLNVGDPGARPTPGMGYAACLGASGGEFEEGSVGAGTGATIGKLFGLASAMKGGVGTWSIGLPGGVVVGALVVVNALGDVRDDETDLIVAGARDPNSGEFLDTARVLLTLEEIPGVVSNTTLAVVATNASLTKEGVNKLAQVAHDGLARVISPVHTLYDGDTIFALSLGHATSNALSIGVAASKAVAEAVKRAVRGAKGVLGIPGLADHRI